MNTLTNFQMKHFIRSVYSDHLEGVQLISHWMNSSPSETHTFSRNQRLQWWTKRKSVLDANPSEEESDEDETTASKVPKQTTSKPNNISSSKPTKQSTKQTSSVRDEDDDLIDENELDAMLESIQPLSGNNQAITKRMQTIHRHVVALKDDPKKRRFLQNEASLRLLLEREIEVKLNDINTYFGRTELIQEIWEDNGNMSDTSGDSNMKQQATKPIKIQNKRPAADQLGTAKKSKSDTSNTKTNQQSRMSPIIEFQSEISVSDTAPIQSGMDDEENVWSHIINLTQDDAVDMEEVAVIYNKETHRLLLNLPNYSAGRVS